MGLLGKIFKKVAESVDDKKKSSKTASYEDNYNAVMSEEIQKDLEQLRKDSDALHKKMSKLPKL